MTEDEHLPVATMRAKAAEILDATDLLRSFDRRRSRRRIIAPVSAAVVVLAVGAVALSVGRADTSSDEAAGPLSSVQDAEHASTYGIVVPTTNATSATPEVGCQEPSEHPLVDYVAPPQTLAEMAMRSHAIVLAKATPQQFVEYVAHQGADVPTTLPYTVIAMEVIETLSGQAPGPSFVLSQGGAADDCWVTNTKLVVPGREYVVAIVRLPDLSSPDKMTDRFMAYNGTNGLFDYTNGDVVRIDPVATSLPERLSLDEFTQQLE